MITGPKFSMRLIRQALAGIIESERPYIDSRLGEVDEGRTLGTVLPYYTYNVDVGMYPLVMISSAREDGRWHGLNNLALATVSCRVWGHVHHDDPEKQADLLDELAASLEAVFNVRHGAVMVADVEIVGPDDALPYTGIEYGVTSFPNSPMVGSFLGTWSGMGEMHLPSLA